MLSANLPCGSDSKHLKLRSNHPTSGNLVVRLQDTVQSSILSPFRPPVCPTCFARNPTSTGLVEGTLHLHREYAGIHHILPTKDVILSLRFFIIGFISSWAEVSQGVLLIEVWCSVSSLPRTSEQRPPTLKKGTCSLLTPNYGQNWGTFCMFTNSKMGWNIHMNLDEWFFFASPNACKLVCS